MEKNEIKSYLIKTYELENVYFSDTEIEQLLKIERGKKMKKNKKQHEPFTNWEDYFIEGTDVLKNIPGIKEKEKLEKHERNSSAIKLVELCNNPIEGNFDYDHLMQIHEYLFCDVYPWAGEIRTVGMSKNATDFCDPKYINNYLTATLSESKKTIKNIKNKFELSNFLATLFYQLIYIHPFREGNGRTIREFIRQLTESLNFEFGSYNIDYNCINNETLAMCLTGGYGMSQMFLAPEFMKALTEKETTKEKTLTK